MTPPIRVKGFEAFLSVLGVPPTRHGVIFDRGGDTGFCLRVLTPTWDPERGREKYPAEWVLVPVSVGKEDLDRWLRAHGLEPNDTAAGLEFVVALGEVWMAARTYVSHPRDGRRFMVDLSNGRREVAVEARLIPLRSLPPVHRVRIHAA